MNTQTQLSEIDRLKLENATLRLQMATKERDAVLSGIYAAYANPDEMLTIGADGTLKREPEPANTADPAVPAAK